MTPPVSAEYHRPNRTGTLGSTREMQVRTHSEDDSQDVAARDHRSPAAELPRPAPLRLVVVDWQTARGFCRTWHRHHKKPPPGHLFRTGVAAGPLLVGVAIVGRPVSFVYDNGQTVEVNRTVTDGYPNANSMLYGSVARAAFALGYTRVITYTQQSESGASLRAAGYRIVAQRPARAGWDSPSRPRDDHGADHMPRTLWEAAS